MRRVLRKLGQASTWAGIGAVVTGIYQVATVGVTPTNLSGILAGLGAIFAGNVDREEISS